MSTGQFNALVINDDAFHRRVLRATLKKDGFAVEDVRTTEAALRSLRLRAFDLVLLSISNMAEESSSDFCRQIRALQQQAGILLISEPGAGANVVQALQAGADDYVTKPVRTEELIGRCHVVLRRICGNSTVGEGSIIAGDLRLDVARRQLHKAGKVIHLTPTEFNLLALLMKNQGVALEHAKLLRSIWGPEYGQELEYLRSYVRLLRKKIEKDPTQPRYLLTEPWLGYRFCNPSQ